jgi:hypothetical protein
VCWGGGGWLAVWPGRARVCCCSPGLSRAVTGLHRGSVCVCVPAAEMTARQGVQRGLCMCGCDACSTCADDGAVRPRVAAGAPDRVPRRLLLTRAWPACQRAGDRCSAAPLWPAGSPAAAHTSRSARRRLAGANRLDHRRTADHRPWPHSPRRVCYPALWLPAHTRQACARAAQGSAIHAPTHGQQRPDPYMHPPSALFSSFPPPLLHAFLSRLVRWWC